MMSSDVDPDARTETLPPVYTGRARAVLITEDGTRVLPGIDTDVTPMAFVDQTRTMLALFPGQGEDEAVAETPRPIGVRVAAVSALVALAVCGMLVVALAMAWAAR
jgi:hypothetical protein